MLGAGGVYVDTDRLQGGDFYNEALARNLFDSATMVMVYTPTYFSNEHTYCAREYKAMAALERDRLAWLGASQLSSHGLIIPIVLRGSRYLPDEIRRSRQYYNFEGFQLGDRRLSRHPKFAPTIRNIAAYISERFQEMQSLPEGLFGGREQFFLPGDDEIRDFLRVVAGFRMPFPRGDSACTPAALSVTS
jgi:hypothetical protein